MNRVSPKTEAPSGLSPEHAQMLAASAISSEVAEARGYRTITSKAELKRLGFSDMQCLAPTLLLPIWGIGGGVVLYHHRPDAPRIRDGKPAKYEFPTGSRMAVDVHPSLREQVRRPDVPLFITEGIKKADAAISAGLCCLAVIGTWNWRGTNEWGGKTALPDWDQIAFKDSHNGPRQVYIVYDSDVMLKASVHQALVRLAAFLSQRGAQVAYVYLPHGEAGGKVGLDDFLASGRSTDDLLALATPVLRQPETPDQKEHPYVETPGGLVWRKPTRDGFVETPLTNFTARIVADILEDDGGETRRSFEIEACRADRRSRFSVPASSFALMNWPMETLGAAALLYPGVSAKDHARAAIQWLSGEPETRQVYAHTGWRQISGDDWAYLHAAGAVRAQGGVMESTPVLVRLPSALERFSLPDPPQGRPLIQALRTSLSLWDLLPDPISIPLFCAVYRSVLGTCDFSLHLAGPSGAFKSELSALAQQHFGAGFDARHLPGSWSSTDNALEGLAFIVKDGLLVLDDFAPTGTSLDVQRLHSKADRILRGQGNNAGRLRMRADATLKSTKFPRGLILSTGEDVPQGLSLRARLLVLEIAPGMIAPQRLAQCQKEARAGAYAESLSGFLAFLAPQYAQVQEEMRQQVLRFRDLDTASGQHQRTPEITANLAAGLDWFLRYALERGAITDKEKNHLWKRGWNALGQAAQAQGGHQTASEPTKRFMELLTAALASGKAHLAAPDGSAPLGPEAWGWRERIVGAGDNARPEWQPHGDRIGWVAGGDVFLLRDAAYGVAKRLGTESGEGLTLTPRTLSKRLHERGLLASVDQARDTKTVRRTLGGQRQDVLHLLTSCFDGAYLISEPLDKQLNPIDEETAQTDQTATAQEGDGESLAPYGQLAGQYTGQFAAEAKPETASETDLIAHPLRWDEVSGGQNGQFIPIGRAARETWRP